MVQKRLAVFWLGEAYVYWQGHMIVTEVLDELVFTASILSLLGGFTALAMFHKQNLFPLLHNSTRIKHRYLSSYRSCFNWGRQHNDNDNDTAVMDESLTRRPPLLVKDAKEAADADAKDLRIDIMNLHALSYIMAAGVLSFLAGLTR